MKQRLSESRLRQIIRETVRKNIQQILTEEAENRNISAAKHYLYKLGIKDEETASRIIGRIESLIPSVQLANYKFLLGVTRMLFNGEFTNNDKLMYDLANTLEVIANDAYVNKYNQDLNGKNCSELIQPFKDTVRYGAPGKLVNGWRTVHSRKGSNYENIDGELISDRWFDACWQFKDGFAKVMLNRKLNYIDTNGELISDIWFDKIDRDPSPYYEEELPDKWFDDNGLAKVKLNGKWNFINTNGELISDIWFDYIYEFNHGYALVQLNGKRNFINTNGELIADKWYDRLYGEDIAKFK